MISLHIEAANLTDLREKVAQALGDVLIPVSSYQPTKPAATAAPTNSPPAAVVTKRTTAAEPEAEKIVEPAPVLKDAVDYDYDDHVKPVVLAVSQKFGRPGIEDLLRPFNVTNAKQVPADLYEDLIAAANKALENV